MPSSREQDKYSHPLKMQSWLRQKTLKYFASALTAPPLRKNPESNWHTSPSKVNQALLRAALPAGTDKDAANSLAQTASALEWLVSLAQTHTTFGDRVLQRLQSVRQHADFSKIEGKVFNKLFRLRQLPDAQNIVKHLSLYREHSRNPNGLIMYVVKIQQELAAQYRDSILEALGKFVNAAILGQDPESDFKRLRYDASASPHLNRIAGEAAKAFEQWQQPCIYRPSAAFPTHASSSTHLPDIGEYLWQCVVEDKHIKAGMYPLLEQVLKGEVSLPYALKEGQRQADSALGASLKTRLLQALENGLLQLLNNQGSAEAKAAQLTTLIEHMPEDRFRQDLAELKKQLILSTSRDEKPFAIVDTDAAEDLFLCGTEVMGSRQNIHGDSHYNRALPAYMLDGKYCMLAVQSDDGRLIGRRMLRLLWDEQGQRPVLHLERLYHNPGMP